MSESLTALPSEWVARLFLRFEAIYGNRATTMYANADPNELRQVWGDELGRFTGDDIREALAILPKAYQHYPPTLYEFADLCSDAKRKRSQTVTKLSGPRTEMPEHIREQLRAFVSRMK
jgi:hypothetical protein